MNELDFSEITRLSEKYSREPKSRIFVQLADMYRKNNMIDEALDVLNKGLEYHPEYALAYLVLGKCQFDKRAYIQAKEAFERTLTLDPQNIVALRMLAKTCEILKDEKGQINAYKSIIGVDPLDTSAKEKLAMVEALQRKEPLYTVAMAEEYEKQDNLDEALKIYEHLLYTDPSDILLNQKATELKKKINDETRTREEEKIEELRVEQNYKADDLMHKEESLDTTLLPPAGVAEQVQAGESDIQSLEDFLIEELEQAADKVAAQPSETESTPSTERTGFEEISSQAFTTSTAEIELDKIVKPPTVEVTHHLSEVTEPEATRQIEPTPLAETPHEEIPVKEEEGTPAETGEKPMPRLESAAPPEETTSSQDKSLEAMTEIQPAVQAMPEKTESTKPLEDIEKKEEPKKPKEQDFKSFQEWLSGLLK
jgi:tetratricopeptide (TPR) repeat protein